MSKAWIFGNVEWHMVNKYLLFGIIRSLAGYKTLWLPLIRCSFQHRMPSSVRHNKEYLNTRDLLHLNTQNIISDILSSFIIIITITIIIHARNNNSIQQVVRYLSIVRGIQAMIIQVYILHANDSSLKRSHTKHVYMRSHLFYAVTIIYTYITYMHTYIINIIQIYTEKKVYANHPWTSKSIPETLSFYTKRDSFTSMWKIRWKTLC